MENNSVICPLCNTENSADSNFCSVCGQSLSQGPMAKQCPECGTVFNDDDNRCGLCGTALVYKAVQEDAPKASEVYGTKGAVVCRHCGAENPDGYKHCSRCGRPLASARKRFCTECGKESSGLYDLCSGCGSSLLVSPVAAAKPKKKSSDSKKSLAIINKSFILLLSALLLAFSFLPIIKYKINAAKDVSLSVKFSVVDAITFAVDNLFDQDEEEMQDSNLYAKFEEATEEFMNSDADEDYVTRASKMKVSKYLKLAFRLALRSNEYAVSPTLMIAAVGSFAYVALALACFVFALISFITHFFGSRSYTKTAMRLMIFVPFAALISHYSFAKAISTMSELFMLVSNNVKTGMGAMLVSVIAAAVLCVILVVQNAIAKNGTFTVKRTVFCAVSLVLLSATLILCSANVFKLSVKTEFENKDTATTVSIPISPEIYDYVDTARKGPNEETAELIAGFENKQAYLNSLLEAYSGYTVSEAKKGNADIVTREVIYTLILCWNRETVPVFSLTSLILTLAFTFTALATACAVLTLCSLKKRSLLEIILSALAFTLTLGALTLNCVLVLTLRKSIAYLEPTVSLRIGFSFGIIAFTILSFLAITAVILQAIFTRTRKSDPIYTESDELKTA